MSVGVCVCVCVCANVCVYAYFYVCIRDCICMYVRARVSVYFIRTVFTLRTPFVMLVEYHPVETLSMHKQFLYRASKTCLVSMKVPTERDGPVNVIVG
jgi:hypothetical protein